MQKIVAIYRHPVKGLRAEVIKHGVLKPLRGLVGDRAFGFQFMDESVAQPLRDVDSDSAPWMSKFNLAVQHDWPELAKISAQYDLQKKTLRLTVLNSIDEGEPSIEASIQSEEGRQTLADFIHVFLKRSRPYEKARHPLPSQVRFIGNPELTSRFTDSDNGSISFAAEQTFTDLGAKLGLSVDPRRFRPNLVLSGIEAWSELKWTGRRLKIGACIVEIVKPLGRCANIDVNPETGERDADIYTRLKPTLGHAMTGVRAEVIQAGDIRVGDEWTLLS